MGSQPRRNVSLKSDKPDPILVTGAIGYVGRRLIPVLLAAGYRMLAALARVVGRPIFRQPERFTPRTSAACNLPPESQEPPLRPYR